MSVFGIKDRLSKLGKTQVWLLFELRERGLDVQPPLLSQVINGVYTYPKAKVILEMCDKILTEVEHDND